MVPDTAEASLRVTAVAADGRIAVTEPLACRPLLIDPFLFPGTGARTVDVAADFDVASPPSITVELVAEGREDDPAASTLLHLARGTPRAQWGRFVGSPFATGYRWRLAGAGAWSELRTDDTLTVPAAGTSHEEDHMTGDGEECAAGLRLLPADREAGSTWVYFRRRPRSADDGFSFWPCDGAPAWPPGRRGSGRACSPSGSGRAEPANSSTAPPPSTRSRCSP